MLRKYPTLVSLLSRYLQLNVNFCASERTHVKKCDSPPRHKRNTDHPAGGEIPSLKSLLLPLKKKKPFRTPLQLQTPPTIAAIERSRSVEGWAVLLQVDEFAKVRFRFYSTFLCPWLHWTLNSVVELSRAYGGNKRRQSLVSQLMDRSQRKREIRKIIKAH